MKSPCARARPQRGAITLLVAITLVSLAALASLYSARSVWTDRLASHNQSLATQNHLAAEAALAWARAELSRQYTAPGPGSDGWLSARDATCPAGYTGLQWQCRWLEPPGHPALPGISAKVLALRDVVHSPHVTQLHSTAQRSDQQGQAQLQASVFVPSVAPAPKSLNTAALVVNGCAAPAAGASVKVCPLNAKGNLCSGPAQGEAVRSLWLADTDADGAISPAERQSCLAFLPEHLPAAGLLNGPSQAMPRSPCNAAAWQSVLGEISPAQIKAWSEAQARNGLNAQSQPPRTIYWVDSAATWTQSLGQFQAPVLLVFSAEACTYGCPKMASGVKTIGTVVLQTECQDARAKAWHAGHIEGQLVVESGLPDLQSGSLIQARSFVPAAYQLAWPEGMDASQVQRVSGSWRSGPP